MNITVLCRFYGLRYNFLIDGWMDRWIDCVQDHNTDKTDIFFPLPFASLAKFHKI